MRPPPPACRPRPSPRRASPTRRGPSRRRRAGTRRPPAPARPAWPVAGEAILDPPWPQRLRRISQLQSARWVFPTAEHSRFTHGLGVMHEAGVWARALLPSLRTVLPALAPGEGLPSEGLVVETLRVAGLLHDV